MGSTVQQTMVPDNWGFNGRYPCLYHGGNYNQNQNHGPFYINYNNASNTNDNIGCRILAEPQANPPFGVVGVPHPFYIARLTAQHLLKKSRQDTA